MKSFTPLISRQYPLVQWIASVFFWNLDKRERLTIIKEYFQIIDRWIKNNGPFWTIRRMKILRNIITRYIIKDPILVNTDKISVTKDGFPTSYIFFKEYIDSGDTSKIRFIMTLLTLSRSFNIKGEVDLSSITEPFTGEVKTIPRSFIIEFVRDFKLDLTHDGFSWKSLFFTYKGGIYGKQLWSAVHSLGDWTGLMHACGRLLGSTSFDNLLAWYKLIRPTVKPLDDNKMYNALSGIKPTRRLSIVYDPELKARVICIFDYFSQVLLEPLSLKLFDSLRTRFTQDRTFTQSPIISNKRDSNSKYYSFDLTSATDRFPIELQTDLLSECVFGNRSYADAWRIMMTKCLTVDHTGRPIAYAVGQPMGARSSWSMFTLSHHLVVQYAAKKAGCYPTDQYILLGDDIVIYDDNVAKHYQDIIGSLGVKISPLKTHVSIDTYEFAKRWFKGGNELTGVPINGILQGCKDFISLFTIVKEMVHRGYVISASIAETTASIINVFKNTKLLNPKERAKAYSPRFFNSVLNGLRNYAVVSRNLSEFNYDEVREFVAMATSRNEYHIPSDYIGLQNEFYRVINTLYCYRFTMLNHSLSRYYDNVETSCKEQFFIEGTEKEIINQHPLLISIENRVMDLSVVKTLEFNDELSLKDKLSSLSLFDTELITSTRRSSEIRDKFVSKFANDLYVQFRDFPDQVPHPGSWGLAALSLRNTKLGFRKGSKRHDDE